MKIFLSFQQSEIRHPIPAYDFWQHYIKNGIEEAGYQWAECPDADWALGLVPQSKQELAKWREETWTKTVKYLKENPVDLFLSYLYPDQVDTSAVKEIQKMGVPCVNFFCDNIRDFTRLPRQFGVFDLNWVPEFKALKLYQAARFTHIALPMPMWVAPQYRVLKEETLPQVTFIGSKDMQRIMLFENVVKKDPSLPLAVYGAGWKQYEIPRLWLSSDYTLGKKIKFNLNYIKDQGVATFLRKVNGRRLTYDTTDALTARAHSTQSFEQYNELLAQSMITLGVNRYESFKFPLEKPNSYSRLRDIEAPMLGACYLTEWTEGMEDLYDIEKEIAVYRNDDDLIEKVKELRADPEKRQALKVNGQKRALGQHAIPNSLNSIKCFLGL